MFKIAILLLGIILASIGLANIILYINLLVLGYSFFNFLFLIGTNFYTSLFFIGVIIIICVKKSW